MELDDALLDRVLIGPIMNQVPRAFGDLAGVVRVGILSQLLDQLNLEHLNLIYRVSLGKPRKRLADVVTPDVGCHDKTVA